MDDETIRSEAAAALTFLREHGWCQGRIRAPDGSACLIGALVTRHAATYEDWLRDEFRSEPVSMRGILSIIAGVINVHYPGRADNDPVGFNNHPGTRFADIEFILETVAAG